MPLQNRVTPFGEIVAIDQRGTLMGNRGIIHDPATKSLLPRRWSTKAWIICVCAFKNVRRDVMSRRSWTELFFLDEAVALAAGHRPCFYCRRATANAFRDAWARGKHATPARAAEMDATLHAERLDGKAKRIHPAPDDLATLPDGTVVTANDDAFTLAHGRAFRWTERAYAPPTKLGKADGMLTPPSTIAALRAGFRPLLHPDIAAHATRSS
ncbi:hypothetical protein GJW-30_1_03655 [Variibacter gotjawalensis]|uniref:Uncharacterized protein n=1 Tax=Variibacter gotjawalensis TaxID=1333996 RepID=A0A0S3PYX8_9BRAD|nr:hypothetical protein [Variibacter gotjawalensis]NIK46936.1 hypothetical protein [Variibacter gotjawalensis]RZS48840.1 hypothetical protein EV661_1262 [Variibacter gotjawalensis]BAT61099.1 hypothetical protein GJW-30_1_03655 [Variibacter gotjawalensis]